MAEEKNFAHILTQAFEKQLENKFGSCVPPQPYIIPFGIKHVDMLFGGGITSSCPIVFSSTPETGKSSIALQFCAIFQKISPNAVSVYLDLESPTGGQSLDIEDRINTFGIDRNRFMYKSLLMDLKQLFTYLREIIDLKMNLQQRTNQEFFVLFVIDSIAAINSSKDADADDVNSTIGFKARELTFEFNKFKQSLSMQRCGLILIDQVRANMQIKMPWQIAAEEKSVGDFGNFKAATNANSFHHNIRQWFWLSKGEVLKPNDSLGVDGWIINIFTEKNKLAPSQYSVPIVFDKKYGVIPTLSELWFMSNLTKTEKKYWKDKNKLPFPLLVEGASNKRVLNVMNPQTGEILYTSPHFNERNFIEFYNSDSVFQQWFNYAAQLSAEQRIGIHLFRNKQINPEELNEKQDYIPEDTDSHMSELVNESEKITSQEEQATEIESAAA